MLKAAPALLRHRAWRSVYKTVASYVRSEKLREALSFHTLLVGGNPMTTSSIYALIHKLEQDGGVWYARGGTNRLVAGMVALFERLGGELRLADRSEEHTSELQSLMRTSSAVFCFKKKTHTYSQHKH